MYNNQPVSMFIDTNSSCNMACSLCPNGEPGKKPKSKTMTLKAFEKTIKHAKENYNLT